MLYQRRNRCRATRLSPNIFESLATGHKLLVRMQLIDISSAGGYRVGWDAVFRTKIRQCRRSYFNFNSITIQQPSPAASSLFSTPSTPSSSSLSFCIKYPAGSQSSSSFPRLFAASSLAASNSRLMTWDLEICKLVHRQEQYRTGQ